MAKNYTKKEMKNLMPGFVGTKMKNFKRKIETPSVTIWINKNDQIHDIQPRIFGGVNLFDFYHGHCSADVDLLLMDIVDLTPEVNEVEINA